MDKSYYFISFSLSYAEKTLAIVVKCDGSVHDVDIDVL